MNRILVVGPHPDDETLGCGGTLLRHAAEGDEIHWLIMTTITREAGFSGERIQSRGVRLSGFLRPMDSQPHIRHHLLQLDWTPIQSQILWQRFHNV
jgi:LmbE family N-acetylglucosaminyl deacetylase|tara:strand:+ start:1219 stop:1506 length:288 start_codon:yes stop_codon:yes gene_type:complete